MNNRLSEIIRYKTGGKQAPFALLMGWSPQYLSKLVRGVDFGLAPIITILQKLPEVNARWFLLGDGEMLTQDKINDVRATAQSYIATILAMEKYLPVMSPSEVKAFESVCVGKAIPDFDEASIERWKHLLGDREEEINNIFSKALCRQRKARQ